MIAFQWTMGMSNMVDLAPFATSRRLVHFFFLVLLADLVHLTTMVLFTYPIHSSILVLFLVFGSFAQLALFAHLVHFLILVLLTPLIHFRSWTRSPYMDRLRLSQRVFAAISGSRECVTE
jgi:hypothetical protein